MIKLTLQIFSYARIYFGLDGERFQANGVNVAPRFASPVTTNDTSRNITVPLLGRMGRYVRIQLHFAAPLILLSEISFESGTSSSNNFYSRSIKKRFVLCLQFQWMVM
jgi:discoidin domain receptor family member 2